jgi:hypothetical protein
MTVTAGATAVGGGDFTVVVLSEVDCVVLLLVESVTMGSAIAENVTMTKSIAVSFLIIFASFLSVLTVIEVCVIINFISIYTITKGRSMKIMLFKLVTHEEVLAEVSQETDTTVVLTNPVGVAVVRGKDGAPNVGFAPFPLHAEQKSGTQVAINKQHVVYSYVPAEDFVNNYNQIFGTGIILPKQQSIITG